MFPFQYLLLDRWPSGERISNVNAPIIIFHGTADKMIPLEQGRQLAEFATNARFIEIPGGEHNDIPLQLLRMELDLLRSTIARSGTPSHAIPP